MNKLAAFLALAMVVGVASFAMATGGEHGFPDSFNIESQTSSYTVFNLKNSDDIFNVMKRRVKQLEADNSTDVLDFNPEDYTGHVYNLDTDTNIWVPKDSASPINMFAAWHRGAECLTEVYAQMENGAMRLDYNTINGGFFVNFEPDNSVMTAAVFGDGFLDGEITVTMQLKREPGSKGRMEVELKSETRESEPQEISAVDVTDMVPADGQWHEVVLSTDVMTEVNIPGLPTYTASICWAVSRRSIACRRY